MVKKILIILGACLLTGYLIFVTFFVKQKPQDTICSDFTIKINADSDEIFVVEADLYKLVSNNKLNPKGKSYDNIDTYDIQQILLSNKMIKSAEVFFTGNNAVKAVIKERTPILRVMTTSGEDYYIDKEGEKISLSNLTNVKGIYLPVVTGDVKDDFAKGDLYKFTLFLYRNKFWNAQIEQIVVQPENNIILIPRVGDHEIILGSLTNYQEKLEKLATFYSKVLSETGWNRYSKINLKYDKQVVVTKR